MACYLLDSSVRTSAHALFLSTLCEKNGFYTNLCALNSINFGQILTFRIFIRTQTNANPLIYFIWSLKRFYFMLRFTIETQRLTLHVYVRSAKNVFHSVHFFKPVCPAIVRLQFEIHLLYWKCQKMAKLLNKLSALIVLDFSTIRWILSPQIFLKFIIKSAGEIHENIRQENKYGNACLQSFIYEIEVYFEDASPATLLVASFKYISSFIQRNSTIDVNFHLTWKCEHSMSSAVSSDSRRPETASLAHVHTLHR